MPKQPNKTEKARAAILDKLFDGMQNTTTLVKDCGATSKLLSAMLKADTIRLRADGYYEATDDGRTLVRIARKKASK